MADELGITAGAYSKIETGKTDPSIGRIGKIAEILGVEVMYFFHDQHITTKTEDPNKSYGFATKADVEELISIINSLKKDVDTLKASFRALKANKRKDKA